MHPVNIGTILYNEWLDEMRDLREDVPELGIVCESRGQPIAFTLRGVYRIFIAANDLSPLTPVSP